MYEDSLICLDPYQNECEVFSKSSQTCFDSEQKICLDWRIIFMAIILSNSC